MNKKVIIMTYKRKKKTEINMQKNEERKLQYLMMEGWIEVVTAGSEEDEMWMLTCKFQKKKKAGECFRVEADADN